MLTLTENARTILNTLTSQPGAEDINALRISADDDAGQPSFVVTPAEQPQEGDQVVEEDGATVYLTTTAAQQLDDKVLDAGLDDNGNVQFALDQQA
ncbi:iron-sulfur cluster biosynthesis family protein [Nocardioides terrisoli]|uniref:iron-sulfur cluster biosynthesis family protein n=1 Tax=Nocardioides terrisoli TaxID=3388267 RepID=UPI00287BA7F8|nr:iron-sulfur cluster biosynthesis family protein [Nocardioides marmorisolisilvae]